MEMYADLFPGDVTLLGPRAKSRDVDNLGAVARPLDALRFKVVSSDDLRLSLRDLRADVVLLPLDERYADLVGAARRTVFAAEHTGQSRLEMALASRMAPLDRLRAEVGFRRLTGRLRSLASAGDGIQCNGPVAWNAYASHNPRPLRLYDNRVRHAQVLAARQQRPGESGSVLRLGFSGRLIPIKGPQYAVRALAGLRAGGADATLDVFGDGPMRGELEAIAGLGVRFHGSLDFKSEWCPRVAAEIDLMVLPHVQSDPSGTYLESAGMGVPVVGFDNDALRYLVDVAQLGWISPRGDESALVRRISDLSRRPGELARAGADGSRFMQEHCFERDFEARVDHLQEVLASSVK